MVAAVLIKPIVFHLFGMYRRYWRYASVSDPPAVLLAASASFVAMGILVAARLVYDRCSSSPERSFCLTGCRRSWRLAVCACRCASSANRASA